MIRDIFTYSQCPNESLRNSVEGFTSFDGKVLQLDEGDDYIYSIEIAGNKWNNPAFRVSSWLQGLFLFSIQYSLKQTPIPQFLKRFYCL